MMLQVLGFLPATQATCWEFLALGFSLVKSLLSELNQKTDLSLSLPPTHILAFKYINNEQIFWEKK